MMPDTTYIITQYWRNGKRIDRLATQDGCNAEYYLMMQIQTPAGMLSQSPKIDAVDIDDAYAKSGDIEKVVIAAVKAELEGKNIVTAQALPTNRFGPGGIIIP